MRRRTLEILPGKRWQGKIHVVAREDAGYAVEFDAEAPNAHPNERYVFDRTVLTPEQLEAWTGWREEKTDFESRHVACGLPWRECTCHIPNDDTELGKELAEMERTNPEVKKAAHKYEEMKKKLLKEKIMADTRDYVVRIVLDDKESDRYGVLIEMLRYAGITTVHRTDETGMCFDIFPPSDVDSKVWANQNAERIRSFGINAVCAPKWQSASH